MNKNNLRNEFMSKRENLKNKIIIDKSKRIISNFLRTDFYKKNNKIFIYVSYKNEVKTHDLIKKMLKDKKEVYVPNPNPETKEMEAVLIKEFDDLTEGNYGILEPI
ncbi:MAG: 5-formyltetrahydrofolate cyclo-ligase, partial [Bacillota bacterium]